MKENQTTVATRYDFTATADFLNEAVPLSDLRGELATAMLMLPDYGSISRKTSCAIWDAMLTVSEFLDTIGKEGGELC